MPAVRANASRSTLLGSPPAVHWALNWSPPGQNGRHSADDMFKCIFLNENIWISNKISLKYVPWGVIDNMTALVQITAWRRPGDKPLSGPMLTIHRRIYAPLGADELRTNEIWIKTKIFWPQWVNMWPCPSFWQYTKSDSVNYRLIFDSKNKILS